jgi:transposase
MRQNTSMRNRRPGDRSSPSDDSALSQIIFPYGVGIDTHSGFIQVCVIWHTGRKGQEQEVRRVEKEFSTEWPQLVAAHEWTMRTLKAITPRISGLGPDSLRYCIESTGTYHMPVLLAWRGIPCVVNPLLAGPTRRKTDVLDARLLAHHSITGLWKPSFIPSQDAQELRVIWAGRGDAVSRATRCSNQINNIILRFGHTFGRDCAMRSAQGEGIICDLLDGRVPQVPTVNPAGLPASVRPRIAALQADMRTNMQRVKHATIEATNFIKAHDWPISVGTMPGTSLLNLFHSVPGVGETTAITWLAEACDPRRFQVDKQVAAFSGCDPSLKVSAGKVTSLVRRQGNQRLHQALLYAAAGLLRRPAEPLGAWGKSITGRHKKGGQSRFKPTPSPPAPSPPPSWPQKLAVSLCKSSSTPQTSPNPVASGSPSKPQASPSS